MQIKKRYFVVALALLLGLTTVTFANPQEEMDSKKTAKGISERVINDRKENNSYSEALEAVEVAEENPTVETVETARNEIRNADDATEEQVENLQQRVDVVEETIDVAALVKEVETLAEVKETRETAKEKYTNAEKEVNKLAEGEVKDNLQTRLAKVSRLLNDKEAPEIKGVNEKVPTKNSVTINVTDEYLTSVKVNDKEYTAKDFTTENDLLKLTAEASEEGKYTVVATDKLGNSVTKTFTIDKTAPGRVYSTVRVNKTEYEENKVKYYYVKNGDSFVFAMQFTEELAETPVVKIAGREVEMKLNQKVLEKENKVLYEGTFAIPANEKELKQGNLDIKLSNVKDLAGNEATSEIVLNQTKTSNSRTVIYDCKNPVIAGVNNNRVYTAPIKITEVDYIVHNVSPIASATIDGEEYILGTEYAKEGKHQFIAYDRAGNRVRVNFEIDTKAPVNSYVAILSKADNYKYAKNGDTIRFLVAFNEEVKLTENFTITFNNKTKALVRSGDKTKWEYIAEFKIPEKEENLKEGLLTFEVKGFEDIHGNASEEVLKVGSHYKYNEVTYDRTPPEVKVDYRNNGTLTDIVAKDATKLSFNITGPKNHNFDSGLTEKRFSINWLGGGTYKVTAKDSAGNTTTVEAKVLHIIDSIDDLKKAFEYGGQATLSEDVTITEPIVIPEGVELVIDLNDKELKADPANGEQFIINKGKLTIKNGDINNDNAAAGSLIENAKTGELVLEDIATLDKATAAGAIIANDGKLTITNSNLKLNEKKIGRNVIANRGELSISGTKITSQATNGYAITMYEGNLKIDDSNLEILSEGRGGIWIVGGNLTIDNAKINVAAGGTSYRTLYISDHEEGKDIDVTINGGEFTGYRDGIYVGHYDNFDIKLTINGGVYDINPGKNGNILNVDRATESPKNTFAVSIKGGTYKNVNRGKVDTYIADGYILNEENKVVKNAISVTTPVALQELFANPKSIDGKTIILENDLDMTGIEWKAANGVSFTLDGNGHTIKNLSYTTDGNIGIFVNHTAAKNLTFKNLTIDNANLKSTGTKDTLSAGFFVGTADTADSITIKNCAVKNSKLEAYDYAGGFIGYTAGWNKVNDGPVYSDILIEDSSFINNTIKAGGSVGGAIAHAGGNPDTTVTIKKFKAENNVLNGETGRNKTGIVIGTAHVGKTIIENVTQKNNTVLGVTNSDTIYGRFVPNSTGTLTIDGTKITN